MLKGPLGPVLSYRPLGPVLSYRLAKTFQIVANEEKFFDWSHSSVQLDVSGCVPQVAMTCWNAYLFPTTHSTDL
jgi:hypothetical protein